MTLHHNDEEHLLAQMKTIIHHPSHPLAAASIGIIKNGEILFADTVGFQRIALNGGHDISACADTKYRMASISKLLTATGIWQQIERGVIAPEDDISDYLGFRIRNPHFPSEPITIQQLLSHTSSICEGDDSVAASYSIPYGYPITSFFDPTSPCACQGAWGSQPHRPGTYFEYANINYGLLGTILEAVTGERFDHYMNAHIFDPLHLDCGFHLPTMTRVAREHVGTIYRKLDPTGRLDPDNGTWTPQCDATPELCSEDPYSRYVPGTNATIFSPQGGLRASVKDMLVLMQMWIQASQEDHPLLKTETLRRMFTSVWEYNEGKHNGDGMFDRAYAAGPQIFTDTLGVDRWLKETALGFSGHSADAYGLFGLLGMNFERRDGLIVVASGASLEPYEGEYSAFDGWRESLIAAACQFAGFGS